MLLQVWIAAALAMLCGQASSMFLGLFLGLSILLAGHFSPIIKEFGESVGGFMEPLTAAVYDFLPNFQILDLSERILDLPPLPALDFAQVLIYGATETALLVTLSCLLFLFRDL